MSQKYLGGYLADTTTFTYAVAGDSQFNYVTALLHGDGTNGAQNNTFLDSSTNALSITRNGNTTQGTFSPYGSNWSIVTGSGSYLNTGSNAALGMGTGDFTVEAWIFATAAFSGYQGILADGFTTGSLFFGNTAGGFGLRAGSVGDILVATAPSINQWVHVAVTRSSTTVRLFYNGVQQATTTNSTNFPTQSAYIGNDGGGSAFTGYISNLRLVKGTAVYTSNFTPSTTPLTAISGTSLLTCQSNRFIDNSSNAFALTVNGSPSIQRFSPFNATAAYSTSTIGGSGYFDGTGDYLLTASNAAFTLAGDFTIEGWMYMTAGANDISLFTLGDANASTGIQVYYYNSAIRMYSGATIIASSTVPNFNAWIHVAVVRSGTTVTLYLNGVSNGTATKSTTYSGAFYTGASSVGPGEYMKGNISDIRVVNGTAVYTTTFTPPTAPLTAITNTSYLLSFTNAGIYDNAMISVLETVGTAQISTSVYKYGTGSIYFNGSSYITVANTVNYSLPADFTIEFWAYPTVLSSVIEWISKEYGLQIYTSGTAWGIGLSASNNSSYYWVATTSISATLNTWQHIAVVRSGNNYYFFVNGVSGASTTSSSAPSMGTTYPLTLGAFNGGGGGYNVTGYLDDLRITNGYARYTTTFTPPTAAFPNAGPTTTTTSIVPTATAAPGIWTMEQQAYYKAQSLWPTPPPPTPTVDYIVVAGGGGGGRYTSGGGCGGGGAGGFRTASSFAVSSGSALTVTVGAGGAAATNGAGSTGSNSVFSTITANGGGGGGSRDTANPGNGGSGGGAAANGSGFTKSGGTGNTPSTSPSQGNNGGNDPGPDNAPYLAAGGGGASAVGANRDTGTGGAGTASSYSGSSVTYAGGGAGGSYSGTSAVAGGAGGGGNGGYDTTSATSGTANRGGGGGGSGNGASSSAAGAGGSGVVVIRYANTYPDASATTGSPTYANTGGYKIYTFTSSGTITF